MRASKQATAVRREQIAAAALTVVASQGLRAMTVGRVARLVGLTPSGLYRHFVDKDDILEAVLELLHSRFLANLAAAREAGGGALDILHRLLLGQVRLILEFQAIPRILFSDEIYSGDPGKKARMAGIIRDFLAGVAEVLRQGQEAGAVRRELDPALTAPLFIGLFQPAALLWHLSGGDFDLTDQVSANWSIFASAVAAPQKVKAGSR